MVIPPGVDPVLSFRSRPSFWTGVARLMDFGGALRVRRGHPYLHERAFLPTQMPRLSDTQAIASDWAAVGDDLRVSMSEEFRREQ